MLRALALALFLTPVCALAQITCPSPSGTPTPITACGDISGYRILDRDISSTGNCLNITANNTYIVGADRGADKFAITAGGRAISNFNKSCMTVKNIKSESGVYLAGDQADGALIENSEFSDFYVVDADYFTARFNKLKTVSFGGDGDVLSSNITFTDNIVRSSASKLIAIRGWGSLGRETPPPECARTGLNYRTVMKPCEPLGHYIARNQFTNDWVCAAQGNCDEPMIMYLWCANGVVIEDNILTATGDAQGIRMRDETDNSTFRRNTVWTYRPDAGLGAGFGSLNLTVGNNDACYTNPPKQPPSNNTFENNIFRSGSHHPVWMQGAGPNNSFIGNIFWANSGLEGAFFSGPQSTVWRNNTFVNTGGGPAWAFDMRGSGQPEIFKNNLIMTTGSNALVANLSAGQYNGDYNGFIANGSSMFGTRGNFSSWKSYIQPSDSHSTAEVITSPALYPFVDAANGNFHLRPGSPYCSGAENGSYRGALTCDNTAPAAPQNLSAN